MGEPDRAADLKTEPPSDEFGGRLADVADFPSEQLGEFVDEVWARPYG